MIMTFFLPGLTDGLETPLFQIDLPEIPSAGDIISVKAPQLPPGIPSYVKDGRYLVKRVHWRIAPDSDSLMGALLEFKQVSVECEPAPATTILDVALKGAPMPSPG